MTFGNEQTTAKALEQKNRELKNVLAHNNHDKNDVERLEAEISLLEMGITPNTNLEMM